MINNSTYLIIGSTQGYFQYPLDSLEEQFKSYQDHFSAETQIVIHRKPNLMFYTYMRRLSYEDQRNFLGLSVVINGWETNSIKSLFRLFERVFQEIVSDGRILTMDKEGSIILTDDYYSSCLKCFDQISDKINRYINVGSHTFSPMQPIIYSSTDADYDIVSLSEEGNTLKDRMGLFNILYVTKSDRTTSAEFNGLSVRIGNLNDQIAFLKEENEQLKKEISGNAPSDAWKTIAITAITITVVLLIVLLYGLSCGLISFNFA